MMQLFKLLGLLWKSKDAIRALIQIISDIMKAAKPQASSIAQPAEPHKSWLERHREKKARERAEHAGH